MAQSGQDKARTTGGDRRPDTGRPVMPADYGVPESLEGTLDWSYVTQRMEAARNYWIATTRPDGRPHVTPVWGVWVDDTFYHGSDPATRRGRNLAANPAMAVHLEDGTEVVIVEGRAEFLTEDDLDLALVKRIGDAFEAKYSMRHGTPIYAMRPTVVFAWTKFPADVTRWRF
jgi:nitroimidazol reductase NimA-like FMN-containing flavoprotein (pyridoxamine 5'-phosphate oxidase superfamily)